MTGKQHRHHYQRAEHTRHVYHASLLLQQRHNYGQCTRHEERIQLHTESGQLAADRHRLDIRK